MMKHALRLQLTCINPPPAQHNGQATEFGLQDRDEHLMPGFALPDGALVFTFEVRAVHRLDGSVVISGRFVHGPPQGRFLYLGWRPPGSVWIRRIKVPLAAITPELANAGTLAATVAGDRSATVALQQSWHVAPDDGETHM
jgi:hypothetical protein